MTGLRSPETCKYCGERVRFVPDEAASFRPGSRIRWVVIDSDHKHHECKRNGVKVYTEEEKLEFARKRAAGEI